MTDTVPTFRAACEATRARAMKKPDIKAAPASLKLQTASKTKKAPSPSPAKAASPAPKPTKTDILRKYWEQNKDLSTADYVTTVTDKGIKFPHRMIPMKVITVVAPKQHVSDKIHLGADDQIQGSVLCQTDTGRNLPESYAHIPWGKEAASLCKDIKYTRKYCRNKQALGLGYKTPRKESIPFK